MTVVTREPGTYRTHAGTLIHLRRAPDGGIVLEPETRGGIGGLDDLVKLSDDPDWPDAQRRSADPELFAD